jgi:hypothetical protein
MLRAAPTYALRVKSGRALLEFVFPEDSPHSMANKDVGGIHHAAYQVADVVDQATILRSASIKPLEKELPTTEYA